MSTPRGVLRSIPGGGSALGQGVGQPRIVHGAASVSQSVSFLLRAAVASGGGVSIAVQNAARAKAPPILAATVSRMEGTFVSEQSATAWKGFWRRLERGGGPFTNTNGQPSCAQVGLSWYPGVARGLSTVAVARPTSVGTVPNPSSRYSMLAHSVFTRPDPGGPSPLAQHEWQVHKWVWSFRNRIDDRRRCSQGSRPRLAIDGGRRTPRACLR